MLECRTQLTNVVIPEKNQILVTCNTLNKTAGLMLITKVDVGGGLTNDAYHIICNIITKTSRPSIEVGIILVRPEYYTVEIGTKQNSQYKTIKPNAVPKGPSRLPSA